MYCEFTKFIAVTEMENEIQMIIKYDNCYLTFTSVELLLIIGENQPDCIQN